MYSSIFCNNSFYTIDKNGTGIIEWTIAPHIQKKYILIGHKQAIRYLFASHNKEFIISTSNTELLVWNRSTHTCMYKRTNGMEFLTSTEFKFSDDFRHVISRDESSISVWDLTLNKRERHSIWTSFIITFDIYDNTRIVIGFKDGRIILWDYLNGTSTIVVTRNTYGISCITCQDNVIYWSDTNGTIMFTNDGIGRTVMKFPTCVTSMKILGKDMLFTLINQSNEIWDLEAGKLIYYFNGPNPVASDDLMMFISNDCIIDRMKNTSIRLIANSFDYVEYQAILGLNKLRSGLLNHTQKNGKLYNNKN